MGMKVLVVGGVAGGASAAARVRRLDEYAEVIVFERGPDVSFSNCALPYHLSGVVEDQEDLVLMTPDEFKYEYDIDARVYEEVIAIDREQKEVLVRRLKTGEEYRESYDKLILSPGAKPILPKFQGMDQLEVFTVRNVQDIGKLSSYIKDKKRISVIGGGFIGIEVAENLKMAGYDVSLIEAMDQVMKPFDYDMVQILHKELYDNGIDLILGDKVVGFEKSSVILDSGKKVYTDALVMAIGVSPETDLARKADLEIGETGGIMVNHNYQTNDKDIYAVGDAIEIWHKLMDKKTRLPLAGPAQKQARIVADHIYGRVVDHQGVIGSSVVQVFNMNAASTGLNEAAIKSMDLNLEYDTVTVIHSDSVELMPESEKMHFKLIFEIPNGRVLGAQAIGRGNVDKRIDVIATLINFNGSLSDLSRLELTYAPPFGTAKDVVNIAGLVGLNILRDEYRQIGVNEIRDLVEAGHYFLDIRKQKEYDEGHIVNSIHIPMDQVRSRINEIPKDRPVYIYCRSGKRSYNIVRALEQRGFDNLYNVSGSFLGLSYYEYFNDKVTGREPIVTGYSFE